jgi:hypothetical protein
MRTCEITSTTMSRCMSLLGITETMTPGRASAEHSRCPPSVLVPLSSAPCNYPGSPVSSALSCTPQRHFGYEPTTTFTPGALCRVAATLPRAAFTPPPTSLVCLGFLIMTLTYLARVSFCSSFMVNSSASSLLLSHPGLGLHATCASCRVVLQFMINIHLLSLFRESVTYTMMMPGASVTFVSFLLLLTSWPRALILIPPCTTTFLSGMVPYSYSFRMSLLPACSSRARKAQPAL